MMRWHPSIMYTLGLVLLLCAAAQSKTEHPMRAAKCVIPNGLEHVARTALLQQCLSKNYAQGNETKCYPQIGCFPMDYPWTTMLRPLPSPMPPAEIGVTLHCYTRASPRRYNVTLWPDVNLDGCPFQANRTTMLLAHGYVSDGNLPWMEEFKDRYLEAIDANVFLVDWGKGAKLLSYLQATSNTRIVGAELARFIKNMEENHKLNGSNVHLIGHSLGAQIAAYVGKGVPGIGRLTALDPAQPGFEGEHKSVRLDKSDAGFVEVVHTNAAPFIPNLGFGMIQPHGDVDFYINGGMHQPGCQKMATAPEIKSIKDLAQYPIEVVGQWVCCSHCRSYEYYMRVLQPNCMIWGRLATLVENVVNAGTVGLTEMVFSKQSSCESDSCIPLNLITPSFKARGTFAASTHFLAPYCESDSKVNGKHFEEIFKRSSLIDKLPGSKGTEPIDKIKESILGTKTISEKSTSLLKNASKTEFINN